MMLCKMRIKVVCVMKNREQYEAPQMITIELSECDVIRTSDLEIDVENQGW